MPDGIGRYRGAAARHVTDHVPVARAGNRIPGEVQRLGVVGHRRALIADREVGNLEDMLAHTQGFAGNAGHVRRDDEHLVAYVVRVAVVEVVRESHVQLFAPESVSRPASTKGPKLVYVGAPPPLG